MPQSCYSERDVHAERLDLDSMAVENTTLRTLPSCSNVVSYDCNAIPNCSVMTDDMLCKFIQSTCVVVT